MSLDFDLCYRAISSRDARFDGRFITAVTSTGIYCRPICPAQTPRPANVRFYPCVAAAEAAGFRACRRCRPETSPGSPDWNLRADLVARALRLIAEGVVDAEGVGGLARRLAVSERHLHRELVAEVGAGPLALARTRRAQTARLLLDQTALPITTVAFAAGFASIRQFNETMQASFGRPPTALRRGGSEGLEGAGELVLRLPYRPPLDSATLLAYFARRAVAGLEEVVGGVYRRTVALPRSHGALEFDLRAAPGYVSLRVALDTLADLGLLTTRCRYLLDLEADPGAISAALTGDALLSPLVAARSGLRVAGTLDGFETAVRTVVGQGISVAAAGVVLARLVARLGQPLAQPRGALTHLFPAPGAVASGDLAGLGLTAARVTALRTLAAAVAAGDLVLDRGADRAETQTRLLAIPGIGHWTAATIAMRALGDPDALPAGDLVLRQALGERGRPLTAYQVAARAEGWRPWRAYAAAHLWASVASPPTVGTPA